MALNDWLTQEEAAKELHVALDTMRRYVREGQFPRVKVGKRYLIPSKAIEEFLQKNLQYEPRPVKPRKAEAVSSGDTPAAEPSASELSNIRPKAPGGRGR